MKKTIHILLVLVLGSTGLHAQKVNKTDSKGLKHGRWITFHDEEGKQKATTGKYRHGKPVGRWTYFDKDGKVERQEKSFFKKVKVTTYHPDRGLTKKGRGRYEIQKDTILYYYEGPWDVYNSKGELIRRDHYKKGAIIRVEYLHPELKKNQSTIAWLKGIDSAFTQTNLHYNENLDFFREDTARCREIRKILTEKNKACFKEMEVFLDRNGYPGYENTNDQCIVPFFVISYADLPTREKYLTMFKNAAERGDVRSTSFAFYADRVLLEQGKKQLYGTQYYTNKAGQKVSYPVEDPENLSARRRSMGFAE